MFQPRSSEGNEWDYIGHWYSPSNDDCCIEFHQFIYSDDSENVISGFVFNRVSFLTGHHNVNSSCQSQKRKILNTNDKSRLGRFHLGVHRMSGTRKLRTQVWKKTSRIIYEMLSLKFSLIVDKCRLAKLHNHNIT